MRVLAAPVTQTRGLGTQLVLQRFGGGCDDNRLAGPRRTAQRRQQVGQRFAGPRRRLDREPSTVIEDFGHGMCHLVLRGTGPQLALGLQDGEGVPGGRPGVGGGRPGRHEQAIGLASQPG